MPHIRNISISILALIVAGGFWFVRTHQVAPSTASASVQAAAASFAAEVSYGVGTGPRHIYEADLDNDGDIDLVLSNINSNNISVLLNNGAGTFAAAVNYAAGTNPYGIYAADYNRDGYLDLAIGNASSANISIFINNGNGTFAAAVNYSTGANGPRGVFAADFDDDGDIDVVSANRNQNNISVLLNNGAGTFAAAVDYATSGDPEFVRGADLDKDGDIDLATANPGGDTTSILMGTGTGTFAAAVTYPVGDSPFGIEVGDVDKDGDVDLAFSATNSANMLIVLNSGTGTFGAATAYAAPGGFVPASVDLHDLDNDGDLDVVIANANDSSTHGAFYLNTGTGTFSAVVTVTGSTAAATCIVASDFDKDGDGDFATANLTTNTAGVFLNTGSNTIPGTFEAAVNYAAGTSPAFVATADFNNNGTLDLVTANSGGGNVSVLSGVGDGTFTFSASYSVGTAPNRIAIVDFNNDGDLDLAVSNLSSNNASVLLGNGDLTFGAATNFTGNNGVFAVRAGDFNRDGDPDLAIANQTSQDISILLGNGAGSFAAAVNYAIGNGPREIVTGDFDLDGNPDLAVNNGLDDNISVLLGNGDGTFAAQVTYAAGNDPFGFVTVDLNKDGKLDFAVSNENVSAISVLLGVGDGTFGASTNYPTTTSGRLATAGDVNNDGNIDIITTLTTNFVSVLTGNGDGTLDAAVDYAVGTFPFAVATGDFDLDGAFDLVSVNLSSNNVSVLMNEGLVVPLVLNSISPARNAIAVAPASNVVWVFASSLNTGSINSNSIVVTGSRNGEIAGSFSFSTSVLANDTVTFNPSSDFFAGEVVTATVTTAVLSADGDPMAQPSVSQFTVDATAGTGIYTSQRYAYPGISASEAYYNCSGDFNSDGDIDIATSFFALSRILVYVNTGSGLFADPVEYAATSSNPFQMHCADVSGDGNVDILFSNFGGSNIGVLISNGDDTFATAAFYSAGASQPQFLTTGDFDGDGDLDIAHAQQSATSFRVLLNAGAGTFGAATAVSTGVGNENRAVAAGDFDNNGRVDIALITAAAAGTPQVMLFWGNGDGTFASGPTYVLTGTANQGRHILAGNLNGDAYLDILAVHENNDTHVLLNNGNQTFAAPVAYNPFAGGACQMGALEDIDSDNDLDILIACSGATGIGMAKNNGSGIFTYFTDVQMYAQSLFSVGTADLNGDGGIDVSVAEINGPARLYVRFNDASVPQASVVQPNGGETLSIGASYDIIWRTFDNSGGTSLVDVAFTINDSTYNPVPGGSGLANNLAHPYLSQWGTGGSGNGQFDQPMGMDVDQLGNIYVVDSLNHRVQKFSSTGVFISSFGSFGSGNGQFNTPRDIALDSIGNIFVTDSGNNRVQRFTSSGVYVSQFGTAGTGLTQFNQPWGIDMDRTDTMLIVDSGNNRVQRCFNVSCSLQWGTLGSGNGQFNSPRMLAVMAFNSTQDRVFVVDAGNHRVQHFATNGGFVETWGTNGTGAGQFQSPQGISADAATNVFVSDSNGRVQKFVADGGTFISEFGASGSGNGQFNQPVAITVDSFGRVYVADSTNDRIQTFTPGGVVSWTVPNSATSLGRIRVTATDPGALSAQDSSDAVFSIAVPSSGGGSIQRLIPDAPTVGIGEALTSDSIRWSFVDNANNEFGVRLLDEQSNVLVDVAESNRTFIDEINLEPNTEYSGRTVVAYNDSGDSSASEAFEPVVTLMSPFQPLALNLDGTTLTVGVNGSVTNLSVGASGLLFELLATSSTGQVASILSSGWLQTSTHTFTRLEPGLSYQVRVKARNQVSVETAWSAYLAPVTVGEPLPVGAPEFALGLFLSQNGRAIAQGEVLNPLQSVQGVITVKNTGTATGTNVLVNMLIPDFMVLSEQTLVVNGTSQSAAADTDLAQGNGNAVSAIWASIAPQQEHSVSFTLFFDVNALKGLLDTMAAANPIINLQVTLSATELAAPIFGPSYTIEPDLLVLVPVDVDEPQPEPTPEDVDTIEEVLEETFPIPGQPGFEEIPQGETTTTQQNGSFTLETTLGQQTLTVDGTGQVTDDQLSFMGTTSQPFTTVTLIFNGSVTTIVVSDENGIWRTFVNASELGIGAGQAAQVTVEAIAAKGDIRSERVQIASILVARAMSGEIVADFETQLSPDSIAAVFEQATELVRENEEGIRATLAVSAPIVIVSSVPLWGYLPYMPSLIYHLLGWIFGMAARRKRVEQGTFGVVYDAITKLPVSLAIVRLYDASGKLVSTHVTDKAGRYDALLAPGRYSVMVAKPQYQFPSGIVTEQNHREGFTVTVAGAALPQIPVDPVNTRRQWELASILRKVLLTVQRFGNYLATPLMLVGFVTGLALALANPARLVHWLIVALYAITLVSHLKLKPKLLKAWGVVYDVASNAILPLVTIQLIEASTSKVVTSRLSDYEGRFTFLPEPGSYVVKASKPGFSQVTEVIQSPFGDRQPLPQTITIKKPSERVSGDVPMKQGQ